jgi:hypothetical protein
MISALLAIVINVTVCRTRTHSSSGPFAGCPVRCTAASKIRLSMLGANDSGQTCAGSGTFIRCI